MEQLKVEGHEVILISLHEHLVELPGVSLLADQGLDLLGLLLGFALELVDTLVALLVLLAAAARTGIIAANVLRDLDRLSHRL